MRGCSFCGLFSLGPAGDAEEDALFGGEGVEKGAAMVVELLDAGQRGSWVGGTAIVTGVASRGQKPEYAKQSVKCSRMKMVEQGNCR